MEMLEIKQLRKEYRDQAQTVTAVQVEHFTLQPGEKVALTGPSGYGKTTLLHLISGLLTPTEGEIKLAGVTVSALPEARRDEWRAAHVGYVFQKFNLLGNLTVLENLLVAMLLAGTVPMAARKERALSLLAEVGLDGRGNQLPRQLSMGEQQRVAIVRAVVNSPSLILADEPTASLDQANGHRVLELLLRLADEVNSMLLVATHDPQVMALFSRHFSLQAPEREDALCNF